MTLPPIPVSWWWLVVPLAAWRLYARLRMLVARQRLSLWREGGSVLGLGVLTVVTAVLAGREHSAVGWLAVGLACGGALGHRSLRLTRIEREPEGIYFTPDRRIGVALSALLVGRVLWRLIEGPATGSGWSVEEFVRNASTLFLFGVFAGHMVMHAGGMLLHLGRPHRGAPNGP